MEREKKIRIYNTAARKKEKFIPVHPGEVRMYVCGPTVYGYIHIGNARPLIFFDVVRRYFEYLGYRVTFVQNITDIDDKIIKRSNDEGIDASEVAKKYEKAFFDDCESLGAGKPNHSPRATEYIGQMIGLIKKLVDDGYAYDVNGNVFFEAGKDSEYGNLSGRDLTQMEIGERVTKEVQDEKRDPVRDFALWKRAKEGEPSWNSPWGEGRPGWHSECVVMSTRILGEEFDIHCGGVDLVFPHHENEIAQARCAIGGKFAKYWMHNEFVNIREEKMSKSLGNEVLVSDLTPKYGAEVLRLFILQTHYRKKISFDTELLISAQSAVEKINRVKKKAEDELNILKKVVSGQGEEIKKNSRIEEFRENIERSMNDDFNTARAIGEFFNLVNYIDRIIDAGGITGIELYGLLSQGLELMTAVNSFLAVIPEMEALDIDKIETLIADREKCREKKDWAEADRIRDLLLDMGILLEDSQEGTRWHKRL